MSNNIANTVISNAHIQSYRDKAVAAAAARTGTLAAQYNKYKKNNDIENQINVVKQQMVDAKAEANDWHIAWLNLTNDATAAGTLTKPETVKGLATYSANEQAANVIYAQLNATKTKLLVQQSIAQSQKAAEAALVVKTDASVVTQTPLGAYSNLQKSGGLPLYYNASSVRETYFTSRPSFQTAVRNNKLTTGLMQSSNQPSVVSAATDLWTSSQGSKGMIVTSEQVLKAWNSGSNKSNTADATDNHNYGFQFQYNPGTVSMSYFTSPNVDVTMMTSGQEMFNLAGVSGSQGSVSFQIIINRIFDMSYYTEYGTLKPGIDANDIYAKAPAANEFADIYNKGTMYDVEFLLRVLMGTTMNSYLRGERTADMGWLPAMPVELHLGKSLRYLGTVNSLNLNHMIFNEKMVPMLTTVDIAFARLPDYPATGSNSGASSVISV